MGDLVSLSYIFYTDQPGDFLGYLTDCASLDLPTSEQFELESCYRREETGDGFEDLSFLVVGQGGVEALVLAHKIQGKICFYGSGVEILTNVTDQKMIVAILECLIERARACDGNMLLLIDKKVGPTLSILGQQAFNRNGVPQLRFVAKQDLSQSEDDLFKDLRKSYRSLVNQGRRELSFEYVTGINPNEELFYSFKDFHKKIAGRQTRSCESWDVQFEMIKAGCAELSLGYMEDYGLVSSALFNDYGGTTSYASAVYERSLFDKPLAHANVFEGMLRAKKRGQNFFNLGVIPSYHPDREKEYNIGKFKKGFCRSLSPFIEWTFDL